jgi:hypothetical protein
MVVRSAMAWAGVVTPRHGGPDVEPEEGEWGQWQGPISSSMVR